MLICAKTYRGEENQSHVVPKLFCSLSGCHCMYMIWKRGKYEQSGACTECPKYEGIDG